MPRLARTLFPRTWTERLSNASPVTPLTDRGITAAFDIMVEDKFISKEYRFCFFVDSLDEFTDTSQPDHHTLATRLLRWANGSAGAVKFCVSSRELAVFTQVFSPTQRITLQNFTLDDITLYVRSQLEGYEVFGSI